MKFLSLLLVTSLFSPLALANNSSEAIEKANTAAVSLVKINNPNSLVEVQQTEAFKNGKDYEVIVGIGTEQHPARGLRCVIVRLDDVHQLVERIEMIQCADGALVK